MINKCICHHTPLHVAPGTLKVQGMWHFHNKLYLYKCCWIKCENGTCKGATSKVQMDSLKLDAFKTNTKRSNDVTSTCMYKWQVVVYQTKHIFSTTPRHLRSFFPKNHDVHKLSSWYMVSSTKIPSLQMARCFSRSLTPQVNVLWWHLPWRFSGEESLYFWVDFCESTERSRYNMFFVGLQLCQKFVCKHIVQFGGLKVDDNSRLWSPFGFLVELEMRMEEMLKHFMRWMYASKATLKKVNICE